MKIKQVKTAFLTFTFALLFSGNSTFVSAEENPQLINYGPNDRKVEYINGSIYYPTSNIREWLNSKDEIVHYTNDPPPYKDEIGFLKNFTEEEYQAIAVTQRRINIHGLFGANGREGGISSLIRYDGYQATEFLHIASPNIFNTWKTHYYQNINEKAFILSFHELYEYVQKRGATLKRTLSEAEMKRLNRSDPSYHYFSSTYNVSTTGNSMWGITGDGKGTSIANRTNSGIVPALHVKPDYVFSDGRVARNLRVGDTVVFGHYADAPISWDVINVTTDGFPLLWSEHVLTLKMYDESGEKLLRNSESVVFDTFDVSIATDLQYKNANNSEDVTSPSIRVANETDMLTRRNDKFTIIIEGTDEEGGSGIHYILLPDGTKDYRNMVDYTISENGRYNFVAVDKAGNHMGIQVPIGNISPPPSVTIKSSTTGWTNKDVTVNIETSLNQVTDWHLPSSVTTAAVTGPALSNFTTYADKSFRVSGNVRLLSHEGTNPTSSDVFIRMSYNQILKFGDYYRVSTYWPKAVSVKMTDLIAANGEYISFDSTFQIAGNYFDNLRLNAGIDTTYIDTGKYKIEWKDVKVEFLDKEEIYIEKILLPNGEEIVGQNSYSEVLTNPGDYTYKVLDSRGKVTEKTINVKIDKVNPSASHTLSPNTFTNQDVSIHVTGIDSLSDIKRIRKPNGEWVNSNNVVYYADKNGTYNFTIEDNAGNAITYPVTVSHIDKEISVINFTPTSREWDLSDIAVGINIEDKGVSGAKQYRYAWSESQTKPTTNWSGWYEGGNGIATTDKNGMLYLHIETVDHAGNASYAFSGIYKKLRNNENPMIGLSLFPQPGNWTNQFIEVSISENLDYSGDLYIEKRYEITNSPAFPTHVAQELPQNRKVWVNQEGASYVHIQYTLSNGTRIKQSAGPYLVDTGKVDGFTTNIVNASSQVKDNWTNERIYLTISNPTQTSASNYTKQYRIENLDRDWQTYEEGLEIIVEGETRIFTRIVNEAGTSSTQQVVTSKLDKTPPALNELQLKKGADGSYTVHVNASDKQSNILDIEVTLSDNTKKKTVSTNQLFSFNQLNQLPNSITITDRAGNKLSDISFAKLPEISFASPYSLTLPLYRHDVKASFANGTNLTYQLGNKAYDCTSSPCEVTIDRNTTLIAFNTEGNKVSSHAVSIKNIDKSELTLVLQGKRSGSKITFDWNYSLINGTLICYINGIKTDFANISGKTTTINAENTNYDCLIKGSYSGENIESNRVLISPDHEQPIAGSPSGNASSSNLYIEESRAGTSYFVNTKRKNIENASAPLPPGIFN